MITVDTTETILKGYYLDAINNQLSGDVSPFFNAIEKTSDNIVGKNVHLTVVNSSITGVAALPEDGALPTPKPNRYFDVEIDLKNIFGMIEISDKAIRASAHAAGPFINLLNAETEGLVKSAKANFARMLYGDGSGTISKVISKKSDTELYVTDAKPYMNNLLVTIKGTGKSVDASINQVDTVAGVLTFDTLLKDMSFSGGEKIAIKGAEDTEIYGLASIFDFNNVYGFTKQIQFFNPYEKSYELSSLTEKDLVYTIDVLEEKSGCKPNMILCSHKTRSKIAEITSNSRRIVNSTDIAAGYSSIYVNDVPVYADLYCPSDRIYFINTDDFVLNQLCDWSWLESDGGRILKQIPGKAAYTASLVKYAQLVCKKPFAQGLIRLT